MTLVDSAPGQVYDGIPYIWLDGESLRFSALIIFVPDGFGDRVQPLLVSRGHKIRIVN